MPLLETIQDMLMQVNKVDKEVSLGPNDILKVDFFRLFSLDENIRYNKLKRTIAALALVDYDDPNKQPYIALEVLMERFNSTAIVSLGHPETLMGCQLLVAVGVLDAVPQAVLDAQPV